jgi:hypothetical protein
VTSILNCFGPPPTPGKAIGTVTRFADSARGGPRPLTYTSWSWRLISTYSHGGTPKLHTSQSTAACGLQELALAVWARADHLISSSSRRAAVHIRRFLLITRPLGQVRCVCSTEISASRSIITAWRCRLYGGSETDELCSTMHKQGSARLTSSQPFGGRHSHSLHASFPCGRAWT